MRPNRFSKERVTDCIDVRHTARVRLLVDTSTKNPQYQQEMDIDCECENADYNITDTHTASRPVGTSMPFCGSSTNLSTRRSHGLNDRQKLAIDSQQPTDDIVHATMR